MSYRQVAAPLILTLICTLWIAIFGCGTAPTSSGTPSNQACSGIAITGSLHDSLTGHPVAQGWVFLESGAQAPISAAYNFSIAGETATDTSGKFTLCEPAISSPTLLVALALDSSANAYPPYVVPVSGATNLNLPMGGCTILCGLDGQQQTSAPTTITGVITSDPIAISGTVMAQYAMISPDNSQVVWNLAIPSLGATQPIAFTSAAGNCYAQAPFCTSYSLVLPSQKPMVANSTGSVQQAGPPTYGIYATTAGAACTPPSSFAVFQQDGKTALTATPGAQLTAAAMEFAACSN